jgi:hypothetical protein
MTDATKDVFNKWATWAIVGAKSLPAIPIQNTNSTTSEPSSNTEDPMIISPKEVVKKLDIA